jgi:hypothetical protein
LVFTTPIRLYCKDIAIELAFYHGLKIFKARENFRLVSQQIDPHEFAKIIYETHVVIMSPN